MCGIFGVHRYVPTNSSAYNADLDKIKNITKCLLLDSERRGRDSSGIVICNNQSNSTQQTLYADPDKSSPKVYMYKVPKRASEFIKDPAFEKVLSKANELTSSIFGHTRAHTHGHPSNNTNNHPHKCGNIIGVHNGVIGNYVQAAKELGVTLSSKCDSEVIFAGMDKLLSSGYNIEQTMRKLFSILKGSYACIAVDIRAPHKPILFKHSSPMIIRIKEYNPALMLVASEEHFIQNAFVQHIRFNHNTSTEKKHDCVLEMYPFNLPENHVAVFDLLGRPGSYNSYLADWMPRTEMFSMETGNVTLA